MRMTPMLRQYFDLKQQAGDALLLYRMGDFYELFFEDAQQAAPILGITLTKRRQNDDVDAPMCGVPHHAFDGYLGKLLDAGYRVAVAEQVEDPATAKGLVRREIVRTHTPGTISDADLLDGSQRCYLAAVGGESENLSVAWIEVSTGTFEGVDCPTAAAATEHLARLRPRELLIAEGWDDWQAIWPGELAQPTATPIPHDAFSPSAGETRLKRILGVASIRGFGLKRGERLVGMAGALLDYVETTQQGKLEHLSRFVRCFQNDALVIDRSTLRNLEIERGADGSTRASLIGVLDHTSTRMGRRWLTDWLLRPSIDPETIRDRHRGVAELVDDPGMLETLRNELSKQADLERLAARVGMGQASPRELATLRDSITELPNLQNALSRASAPLLRGLVDQLDLLTDLEETLKERLADEPPVLAGEGVIRPGWNTELDEQRSLARGGKEVLAQIESQERERIGVSSLKVRYNRVFGYFIEVSKANLNRVPDDYERRQTLTNAERFITPELKELEAKILSAEEKATSLDRSIFSELLELLQGHARRLAATAARIAQIDVLASFAERARKADYCRPAITDDGTLSIRDGRHPVLEELRRGETFIPNDCIMDPATQQIVLLTGPNMGGKSTFLRQVALITLMAHAGSFVPAAEAVIGLTDRIFTRVGASDMLARGESTFMVEMTETANILNHATPRSLVILDEVGRGTATFDGLSLAWSIVEHLHDEPEHAAKVLFATHYHELTDLARLLPRLENRSMAVKDWRGSILFLHRVVQGPADHSYGIHVARLAGVPDNVCQRAEAILENLERHELNVSGDPVIRQPARSDADRVQQMTLFRPAGDEIAARLRALTLDQLTPIDALNALADLKRQLEDDD
ncbi:MAG: DNA mismatch repair protein MutS [bacterium]|nr:DNA mismatch repair protein MutS [bacterium]